MQPSIEDVRRFLDKLGDPRFFIECTKSFHLIEPGEVVYAASMHAVNHFRGTGDLRYFLAGANLILAVWNIRWYKRIPQEARGEFHSRLEEAYNAVKRDLDKLQGYSILDVDLDDPQVAEAIVNVFDAFRNVRVGGVRLGPTGASKVIHLLHPRLFVMIDGKIRRAYHALHPKRGGRHTLGRCYLEFLRQSQAIARRLVDKADGEEKLWEAHRSTIPPNSRATMETLGVKESIAKLLDECNYVAITLNKLNELL